MGIMRIMKNNENKTMDKIIKGEREIIFQNFLINTNKICILNIQFKINN